ncbi:MAG: hypothetical protein EBS96_10840 [Spartobacteria bacterium]|nr:hypothetical protein [Spartobacteria bacterium]
MTCFFTPTTLSSPVFCFLPGGFPSAFRNVLFKFSPSREQSFPRTCPASASVHGGRGDIRVHDEVEIKIKISTATSEESCIVKIFT